MKRIKLSSSSSYKHVGTNKVLLPTLTLSSNVIRRILTCLDILDLPSALVLSKDWFESYLEIEDFIWLNLIRRYYPYLEETNFQMSTINDNNDNANTYNSNLITNNNNNHANNRVVIPSPMSNSWKIQFKRRHMLVTNCIIPSLLSESEVEDTVPTLTQCPLLSSYLFQIDFICCRKSLSSDSYKYRYDDTNDDACDVITCLIDPAELLPDNDDTVRSSIQISNDGVLYVNLQSMEDKLRGLMFDHIQIRMHVIQKNSGKQALLYSGCPYNWNYDVEHQHRMDYETFVVPDHFRYLRGINCRLQLIANQRCICSCGFMSTHDEECTLYAEWYFIRPDQGKKLFRSSHKDCECCSCKKEWHCFHFYNLELDIFYDHHDISVTSEEILAYLFCGLHYI